MAHLSTKNTYRLSEVSPFNLSVVFPQSLSSIPNAIMAMPQKGTAVLTKPTLFSEYAWLDSPAKFVQYISFTPATTKHNVRSTLETQF